MRSNGRVLSTASTALRQQRRRSARAAFLLTDGLVLLAAAACSEPESGVPAVASPVALRTARVVSLSGAAGDPLHDVVGGALLNGRIVVANAGSCSINFYTMDGELTRVVGGRGGGPGEFLHMIWMQEVGGHLFVFDGELDRVSEFGPDGDFIGSVNVLPSGSFARARAAGVFPDGSILVEASRQAAAEPTGPAVYRDTVALLRYGPDGRPLDSIGPHVLSERFAQTFGERGRIRWELPLGRRSALAVSGWRYYVIENDEPLVAVHDTSGTVVQELRGLPWEPLSATPEDVAVLRRRLVPPDVPGREQLLALAERVPIPATPPPFGWIGERRLTMLRVGQYGDVWVLEFGGLRGSRPVWAIYGATGELRARVTTDEEIDILYSSGDLVLVRRWNDADVETVELRGVHW